MTTLFDTAYPKFEGHPTDKELNEVYRPLRKEIDFVDELARGDKNKGHCLVLLKAFQRLGYFPLLQDIPGDIWKYISKVSKNHITKESLEQYDKGRTRKNHVVQIRKFCKVKPFKKKAQTLLEKVFLDTSKTKEDLADIINVGIEEIIRSRFELPAFSTLRRMAQTSRAKTRSYFYRKISTSLSLKEKKKINDLFKVDRNEIKSPWDDIKRDWGKPNRNHLKEILLKLDFLKNLTQNDSIKNFIPDAKLKQLSNEASSLDAARMLAVRENKRISLALSHLIHLKARCFDDLGEMLCKRMTKIHNKAKESLDQHYLNSKKEIDELLLTLLNIVNALRSTECIDDKVEKIDKIIGDDQDDLIMKISRQLDYTGSNHFSFTKQYYKSYRGLLFDLVESMELISTSQDSRLLKVIKFLKEIRHLRARSVQIPSTLYLNWVPNKWKKFTFSKDNPLMADRRYFEIAVFSQIVLELKSGDLAIEGSDEFADYRKQLISWAEYQKAVKEYGKQAGIDVDSDTFVKNLKDQLELTAKTIDESFLENEAIRFENGIPILKKSPKKKIVKEHKKLERLLTDKMNPINILDIFVDTEHWLKWTKVFGPLSGYDSKIEDASSRYIINSFCYGCNLGPTQTARSIKGIDRRQISWINQRHVAETDIDEILTLVIDAYNKLSIVKNWGSGKHASADGTKWELYEQNLLSEYHIRYGGYGGIGYYHVSDTYIALFSHFIPCGVWEGVYILNGLFKNQSDIKPDILHADTQGQSTPIFALSYLLGIQLMPRIRNWKDLALFRPSKEAKYDHIDDLFSNNTINWKLIKTHLPDMLRIAISIKKGKITASTILKRLGTFSKKNKLYSAFNELGKAVRTDFLLKYISSQELRKIIDTATNKSESFNNFIKWIFFGGGGVIATNDRYEQKKIMKYSHLASNLVMFHTAHSMSKALAELKKEGYVIDKAFLSMLSPYLTGHINRFGDYKLNTGKPTPPLDFNMI